MSVICLRVVVVVVCVACVTTTPLNQTSPEDVCPSRSSCGQRGEIFPAMDVCGCDALCNTYGDCCYDSEFRNASLQRPDVKRDFRCSARGGVPLYMKIGCKEGWNNSDVEALCVGEGVETDPVSLLPVTSNVTGYTYPSYYCAICNEDILGLRIWNGQIQCDLPKDANVSMNNLVFQNNTWGVLQEQFHECSLHPQIPRDVLNLTRSCSLDVINTCSQDWQDEEVALQCQSYTGVVYIDKDDAIYRNPHCALCNKKDHYSCITFKVHIRLRPPAVPDSFVALFDFTDPSGSNLVGSSTPCNATQVWDPFFKRCRSIVCPKSNQNYSYGKCVTLSDVNSMEGSEPTAAPTTTTTTTTTAIRGAAATTNSNNEIIFVNNTSNPTNTSYSYNKSNNNNNSTTVVTSNNNSSTTAVTSNNNSSTTAVTSNNNSSTTAVTSNTTASVTTNNTTSVINTTTIPDTFSSTTTASEVVPSTIHSHETFPEDGHPILFPEEPTELPTTPSEEEETPTSPPPSTPSPDASTHTFPTTPLLPDTDFAPTTDVAPFTNMSAEFMECYKVILFEGEFVELPNGTMHVPVYERSYTPDEYVRINESLLVCLPEVSSYSRKFSVALGWVSLAGLGLSCTCLLLHLAAFTLMPNLRNFSGKSRASLCLALLASYITLLVNMMMEPEPAGCVTLAAAMYYFFVTSFTWMNVIAFDVWYTMRLTQRQLRVSKGTQWRRFIAYSLYSWLVPAVATMVLVLVDQLEPRGIPEELLPRLGRSRCWFSHRKALLAFFAAPVVIIIVMNCIFFVSTAAIITQTSSTAAAASTRGAQPGGQYRMYLRLAVLMGFTWVSGIAAGYLNLEPLWYVFVVLNTLQGVFIFFAFTFRTQVWQGLGAVLRTWMQRGVSKVIRRAPSPDSRAFELSHTPEGTSDSIPSLTSSVGV